MPPPVAHRPPDIDRSATRRLSSLTRSKTAARAGAIARSSSSADSKAERALARRASTSGSSCSRVGSGGIEIQRRQGGRESLDRGRRRGHGLVPELERRAVVRREQRVAQRPGRPALLVDVGGAQEVTAPLGHLLAADPEVVAVEPCAHESLAGGRLRLGDLVLVVGEDEVDTPGVDVEARAPGSACSSRSTRCASRDAPCRWACPMPAPRPWAPSRARSRGRRPCCTRPPRPVRRLAAATGRAGRAPVGRPGRDAEEDRAVVRAIGVSLLEERADERRHLRDVLGRPGQHVGHRDAQAGHVLQEHRRVLRGDAPRWERRGRRVPDDLSSTSVMFMTQVTW